MNKQQITEADIHRVFYGVPMLTAYKLAPIWSVLKGSPIKPQQMYGYLKRGAFGLERTHVGQGGVWYIDNYTLVQATIAFARKCNVLK